MFRRRVWLATLLAALPLAVACSNPCDDLAVVCDACPDASYAAECRAIVAKQNHSVCSADVAIFRQACPLPVATSSSGVVSSSVAASGAGGAGGGG